MNEKKGMLGVIVIAFFYALMLIFSGE